MTAKLGHCSILDRNIYDRVLERTSPDPERIKLRETGNENNTDFVIIIYNNA